MNKNLVIIMRGVPGSGKTTKAKTYNGFIVSADDFFMKTGKYIFNRAMLGRAHIECREKFMAALKRGEPLVIVDNTNTTHKEYRYYIECARYLGYDVVIDDISWSGLSAKQLADRNVHGCPEESIERMINRYQR